MEKNEFKRILKNTLKKYGFKNVGGNYYRSNIDLVAMISIQKSNYDKMFYINYGFLIKAIAPQIEYPSNSLCDIRGRFQIDSEEKNVYGFNLENGTDLMVQNTISIGVESIILPVLNEGLKKYFELFPEAYAAITLKAKKYLETISTEKNFSVN